MSRSRAKSKGVYAPLGAQYYLDDAILAAGPMAELAWVRTLSFLASIPSDGYVTDAQLSRVVSGIPGKKRAVETLVSVGLLEKVPGGFTARSWLKWNKTVELMGKIRTQDQDRHSAKQGDSDDSPTGNGSDSVLQYSTEQSSTDKDVADTRPDVSRLCNLLADLIEKNGSKRPTIGKGWKDAARLLIDADNRPLGESVGLIQWCQADSFWRANIMSMPKFREKYDTLRLQKAAGKPGAPPRADPMSIEELRKHREASDG